MEVGSHDGYLGEKKRPSGHRVDGESNIDTHAYSGKKRN